MEGHDPYADEPTPPGTIFGNLPRERPGTRSPRRRPGSAEAGGEASAKPKATAPRPPRTTPASPAPDPFADAEAVAAATAPSGSEPSEEQQPQRAGIEDLAWAGVAVAAEAATLGVRLASRTIERLRDGVDGR